MIDFIRFSSKYLVRRMNEQDAEIILALCRGNPLFYEFAAAEPTLEQVLGDLRIAPPGVDMKDKYYLGFFEGAKLVAVMDLIDGYPKPEIAFIGFFMMDAAFQGRGIGSFIILETAAHLRSVDKNSIRLGIDADNPQSIAFWRKNGFITIGESENNGHRIFLSEKALNVDSNVV